MSSSSPAPERTSEEAGLPCPRGEPLGTHPPRVTSLGPGPQAAWAPLSQPPQASWSLGQNWILVYWALMLGSFTAHTEKPTSFQLPSKAPVNSLRGHLPVLNQKLLSSSVACPHWTRCGVPLLEGQISSFKGCQARHLSSSVGALQIYPPPLEALQPNLG